MIFFRLSLQLDCRNGDDYVGWHNGSIQQQQRQYSAGMCRSGRGRDGPTAPRNAEGSVGFVPPIRVDGRTPQTDASVPEHVADSGDGGQRHRWSLRPSRGSRQRRIATEAIAFSSGGRLGPFKSVIQWSRQF